MANHQLILADTEVHRSTLQLPKQKFFPFLGLPAELRILVYEDVFHNNHDCLGCRFHPESKRGQLLRVSRQIRAEALSQFYKFTHFSVRLDSEGLFRPGAAIPNPFPGRRRHNIGRIENVVLNAVQVLSVYYSNPPISPFACLNRCFNSLKRVTIRQKLCTCGPGWHIEFPWKSCVKVERVIRRTGADAYSSKAPMARAVLRNLTPISILLTWVMLLQTSYSVAIEMDFREHRSLRDHAQICTLSISSSRIRVVSGDSNAGGEAITALIRYLYLNPALVTAGRPGYLGGRASEDSSRVEAFRELPFARDGGGLL